MTPKELANVLHTFMCDFIHEEDPTRLGTTNKCEWEIESQIANCWELHDHALWLTRAVQIMNVDPLLQAIQVRGYLELRVMKPQVYDLLIKLERELYGE